MNKEELIKFISEAGHPPPNNFQCAFSAETCSFLRFAGGCTACSGNCDCAGVCGGNAMVVNGVCCTGGGPGCPGSKCPKSRGTNENRGNGSDCCPPNVYICGKCIKDKDNDFGNVEAERLMMHVTMNGCRQLDSHLADGKTGPLDGLGGGNGGPMSVCHLVQKAFHQMQFDCMNEVSGQEPYKGYEDAETCIYESWKIVTHPAYLGSIPGIPELPLSDDSGFNVADCIPYPPQPPSDEEEPTNGQYSQYVRCFNETDEYPNCNSITYYTDPKDIDGMPEKSTDSSFYVELPIVEMVQNMGKNLWVDGPGLSQHGLDKFKGKYVVNSDQIDPDLAAECQDAHTYNLHNDQGHKIASMIRASGSSPLRSELPASEEYWPRWRLIMRTKNREVVTDWEDFDEELYIDSDPWRFESWKAYAVAPQAGSSSLCHSNLFVDTLELKPSHPTRWDFDLRSPWNADFNNELAVNPYGPLNITVNDNFFPDVPVGLIFTRDPDVKTAELKKEKSNTWKVESSDDTYSIIFDKSLLLWELFKNSSKIGQKSNITGDITPFGTWHSGDGVEPTFNLVQ